MNDENKRAISIATRASKLEGSKEWPWRLASSTVGHFEVISKPITSDAIIKGITYHGSWLKNEFTSPWSSSKFLERVGVRSGKHNFYIEITERSSSGVLISLPSVVIGKGNRLPSDLDLMEAIVTLGEYTKEKGGAYQEAWNKGMNV